MKEIGLMDYLFVREEKYGQVRKGIYKICKICNKLFFVSIKDIKNGRGIVCSKKCAYILNSDRYKFTIETEYYNGKEIKVKYIDGRDRIGIYKICPVCGNIYFAQIRRLKKGIDNFCSKKCAHKYVKGSRRVEFEGENNPNWKGGISKVSHIYRTSEKYTDWRTSCMARDNFTCQKCGKKGVMLNVHHIKTVKDIFEENNIETRNDFMNCEELWDLNNGVTLCESCHRELHFGKMDDIDDIKCND